MTQEIIEMARQADELTAAKVDWDYEWVVCFAKLVAAKHDPKIAIADAYRAGVDSGIAAEREACAKVADGWSKRDDDVGAFIGKAIRARGEA